MSDDKQEKEVKNPNMNSGEVFAGQEKVLDETEFNESKEGGESISPEAVKEIKAQIESADLSDTLKMQSQSQAGDLQSLETKEKLQKLLQTAKAKGVVFAVHVAKNMNDPYMLDMLHDALAREGYYKNFLK